MNRNKKGAHSKESTGSLYTAWRNMLGRCYNSSREDYRNYGGRGIDVCARWRQDFWAFASDMGERPGGEYTLDRIDNDKGYSPENCRWTTRKQQGINRRYFPGRAGVSFVHYIKRENAYCVDVRIQGKRNRMYYGQDFFEACCRAFSYMNERARNV